VPKACILLRTTIDTELTLVEKRSLVPVCNVH
jgi:hypothetical protein